MTSIKDPQGLPEDATEAAPVEPDPGLRRRVLAALEPGTRFQGFMGRFAELFDLPQARAEELLRVAADERGDAWVAAPDPRIRFCHFPGGERVAAADCGLVWLAPGTEFPMHRNLGREWIFVLAGGAEEDSGEVWLPGDLVLREGDRVHGFRALGDGPYLFATVFYGGIEPLEPAEP